MVIGAHAVAVYARPRATGDLDLWIRPTPENAERVWAALLTFSAPLHELTREDLTSDDLVFQIGVAPNRIDILTTIGGVNFDDAWPRRSSVELWGLTVPVIGREDLVRSKRAAGRNPEAGPVTQRNPPSFNKRAESYSELHAPAPQH